MREIYLRGIDPEQLRADIVADILDALRPLLADSREPRLVDRQRMADLLGISVPRLDTLVRDGEIPSRLIGTRRLFAPAEVIAAIPSEGGAQ
ncbi:DNA-binding protein [Rosistilla oblonga]|uniref:DNA-binding protein n=1 Tax=Rosistilla oblonga TaxID=2527990 RepID=UPI003A9731F5